MDCAGKRCLRSRVCNGIPLVISASAGQSTTIIALQVRRGPEFAEVGPVRLKCHSCFVTDRSLSLTVVRHAYRGDLIVLWADQAAVERAAGLVPGTPGFSRSFPVFPGFSRFPGFPVF